MTAYHGRPWRERGGGVTMEQLADAMVADGGDIESAHAVFLYDAALETGQEKRAGDYLASQRPSVLSRGAQRLDDAPLPIYPYAKDCAAYLKAHAVARRRGIERIIPAAWHNLEHGPSLEAFSFA
jgi:hypothetical protein